MADLLPSIPDTSAPESADPRVVGLEDDDADDVLGALSSTTARELFAAVAEEPAHPSALADRIDTTLQNCQYHLAKLEDAGLVEVVDTAYSTKGREMDVYAPADSPLVLFAGDERDRSLLSRALGRLLGGLGIVSAASVVAQGLFADSETTTGAGTADGASGAWTPQGVEEGADGAESGDGSAEAPTDGGATGEAPTSDGLTADAGTDAGGADAARDPVVETVSPVADTFDWVGDLLAGTGLEPGFATFVCGCLVLAVAVAVWYRRATPAGPR